MGQLVSAHAGVYHAHHETPIAAALIVVLAMDAPVTALAMRSVTGAELYGWLATISVFGFLTAYGVVVVAMPFHLHRRGRLRTGEIAHSLGAT